jgi:hypothetical protein
MKLSERLKRYAAGGLLLLLAAACDRNSEVPGEMIVVNVTVAGIREGGSEELVRAASDAPPAGWRVIATASEPIGDGLLLDVSLEADEAPGLRAATLPLENGKNFRVIALRGGNYVCHGDFTVNGATSQASLHVPENVSHDFICISYNSADAFTETYSEGSAPTELSVPNTTDRDLLYAKVTKTITATDRNLSFTLEHKLSRVKLVVDASLVANITAIEENRMRITPFYAAATMQLGSGGMTKGASSDVQYFAWPTIAAAKVQTSGFRTVFTNSETVSLVIPASTITISGVAAPQPESAKTLAFPSTLAPGHSYTLRLRLARTTTPSRTWASSNIYWVSTGGNNGYLTFGSPGTWGYQGVYFRWGSLVGISPGPRVDSKTMVFVPTYNTGTPTASTWSVAYYTDAEVSAIPFLDESYGYVSSANNDYSDATLATVSDYRTNEMYSGKRGDICKYLGATRGGSVSGYRMPLMNEMSRNGTIGGWNNPSVRSGYVVGNSDNYTPVSVPENNRDGTLDLSASVYAQGVQVGSVFLPASYVPGSSGYYWSGSAQSASKPNQAYYLIFYSTGISMVSFTRSNTITVRCVKE